MRASRRLTDAALLLGVAYLLTFLVVALIRASFPFEVEWMEGGMVTHAARLLDGERIYAPPSADFVPFFYTPGYPAVLAALARVTGDLNFALARGVSILATLATMGLLFRIGQREAGWRSGLLAVGLYAALFRTNGAFYDLARPDALFIALVAAAVYVARYRPTALGATAAALLFVAGFFTKQTTSVFVPATALYLLWRDWRHGLLFLVVAFGGAALGVRLIDRAHDGWFWTFIFEGHQGHLFYWKNILLEYWRDVLFLAPLLLLLPLLWLGYKVPVAALSVPLAAWWTYAFIFRASTLDYVPHMYYRELWYETPRWLVLVPPVLIAALLLAYRALNGARLRPRTDGFWLLMFVAGVGSSGLNHSTQWAYANCFMPLSLFACALIPLALRDLTEPAPEAPRPRAAWLVPLAVLVQLVAWYYRPSAQVPGAADRAALTQLDAELAGVDGKVLFPAHPLYSWHRDGKVHVHQMGIQDVAFMGGVEDLHARLRAHEWAAVVIDEQNQVPGLEPSYYLGERFAWPTRDALRTKTGFLVRPAQVWYAQDPVERWLADGVTANFEGGAYLGWTAQGEAWGDAPSRRPLRGRQGVFAALSGPPSAKGTLRSAPFTLRHARLTYLMAARGIGRAYVQVRADGEVIARGARLRQPRLQLTRQAIDLSAFVGRTVQIELLDGDAQGEMAIDDLRLKD
mgnify:CR=1 FL=1